MAKGRSCCCSGLSKGWWWFLTLVGLPLLYALMLNSKWGVIEDDISTSTTQKLKDAGAHWVNVDVEGRARDVLLTGTATTDAERDSAIQTALGVDGVRKVDSDITVVSLKERALTANYMHKDGKLVIEGELESQKKVDEMLKLLADKVGLDNIDNKLTVSDKFSPEGGTITLSGMVLSDDKRSGLSSALQAGSSALGLKFADNLEIDTEAVKAIAEVAEKAEADKLAAEKAEADKLAAEKA
ncbi:MAG: BON domain-containing protein, partial [Cocleimonas sp.]|nr:BON domain-containing protein [Cocleimonas sp.]